MILTKDGQKRLLKAEEIECRTGSKSKDKKKQSILLYKTARTDMDILDEVFGSANWKTTHYEVKGKDFCMIEVRIKFEDDSYIMPEQKSITYEWVGKSDCGKDFQRVAEDSEDDRKKGLNEYEKSESSDSFKRAGFMWGIGRELYSAPDIWIDADISVKSLFVEKIGYDESDKINELVICSKTKNGIVPVFTMVGGKIKKTDSSLAKDIEEQFNGKEVKTEAEQKAELIDEINKLGGNVERICKYFNVKSLNELSVEDLERTLEQGKKK